MEPTPSAAGVPAVVLELPSGAWATLHPGDVIGRLRSAALRLDDPRVSEAHAMVSLRGARLWLLGLRGGLHVSRSWRGEVQLEEGQRVGLAEELELNVVSLTLPDSVVVLDGTPLDRPEWSLYPDRRVPEFERDADAWLFGEGEGWRLQRPGAEAEELAIGEPFEVAGRRYRLERQPVEAADVPRTVASGWTLPPVHLEIHDEWTVIEVDGRRPVRLSGNSHLILRHAAELTRNGGSVHWSDVAGAIWRVNPTEQNWFTNHRRLRNKLLEHRLPADLVACRQGHVWVVLRPGTDRITWVS